MERNRHSHAPKTRFTYQGHPQNYFSSTRPDIYAGSSTSTPVFPIQSGHARPASLPPKAIANALYQNQSHIKIDDWTSTEKSKKERRHKIFDQQYKWSFKEESPVRTRQIQTDQKVMEISGSPLEVSPPKATVAIQCQSSKPQSPKYQQENRVNSQMLKKIGQQSAELLKKQEQQLEKMDQRVYQKVIEKLFESNYSKRSHNQRQSFSNLDTQRKDKEIEHLKRQVQRLQRCDKLNKENESIYKRLVDRLKQQSISTSFIDTSYKNQHLERSYQNQKETPINSLNNTKREPAQQSPEKQYNVIINKKGIQVTKSAKQSPVAQKVAQFSFSPAKHNEELLNPYKRQHSDALTFNNLANHHKGTHVKRIRQKQYSSAVRVKRNIKNQFDDRDEVHRLTIDGQLGQINRNLQRKIFYKRSRSKSKHLNHNQRENDLLAQTMGPNFHYNNLKRKMYIY